jgi:hypothetical protein
VGSATADGAAHAERGLRACMAWILASTGLCRPTRGRARGPFLDSLCIPAGGRPVAAARGHPACPSTDILVPVRQSTRLLPVCPAMPGRLETGDPHTIAVGNAATPTAAPRPPTNPRGGGNNGCRASRPPGRSSVAYQPMTHHASLPTETPPLACSRLPSRGVGKDASLAGSHERGNRII